jgi:hypothetical protein
LNAAANFAAALGTGEPPVGLVGLLGLEHEYRLTADRNPLDFRDLIHTFAIPGRRLDPGDANAYRCTSGLAITADDEDAEVASPPLPLTANFTKSLYDWAAAGRSLFDRLLPADIVVDGYSTHLSASVPNSDLDEVVDLFAATFAPALMVVIDRMSSHGVFVRPRPSRLELCGEYVTGERLRAAAAFFAGGARACALAVSGNGNGPLPAALAVRPLVALGRCGLELDRKVTFGFDLYAKGRAAQLPLRDGGTISAQRYLEEAWRSARSALALHAGPGDLEAADKVVAGSSPLGIEANGDHDVSTARPLPPSPYGDLLVPRERGRFGVEAAVATWDFTVFSIRGAPRTAYACVPRSHLPVFLDALDGGGLDDVLTRFIERPSAGRTLAAFAQTEDPGLWDDVGEPTALLPSERDSGTTTGTPSGAIKAARAPFASAASGASAVPSSAAAGVAAGTQPPGAPAADAAPGGSRYGKPPVAGIPRRSAPQFAVPPPPPPPPPEPSGAPGRGRRRAVVVVLVALVVLAGVALALVLAGGSGKSGRTGTTTSTTAVAPETTVPSGAPASAPPETHGPTTRFSNSARTTAVPVTRRTTPATTAPPPVTTRVAPTTPATTSAPTTAPPRTTLPP